MKTAKISVLIIEDSALMRILLTDILKSSGEIELVGAAKNGKEGVEKALKLRPDVVITDMIMPDYDGLYVVDQLAEPHKIPVIVLSALNKDDQKVFQALENGAFDFLDKPKDDITNSIKAKNYPLIDLVKTASKASVKSAKVKPNQNMHSFSGDSPYSLIVLGASTGGPSAIEKFILQLPKNLSIPIIIAQHMPHTFIESFANRLNQFSPLQVTVVEEGEVIQGGKIYLASGLANTELLLIPDSDAVKVSFTDKEYADFNNPSIDCLMSSAAKIFREKLIGVILTGMGKDGGNGLLHIRNAGGLTIAQDEATSVVYGMPKYAWDIGATDRQVPIDQLAGYIMSVL